MERNAARCDQTIYQRAFSINRYVRRPLVEHKTLASLLISVQARAKRPITTSKIERKNSMLELSRLRVIGVLWCGASAFSPLVAGHSILSTAGAML